MSDTPNKYKWVLSSSPCTNCQGLATSDHPSRPARPHKRCQCTIVSRTGKTYNGQTHQLPRIMSVKQTGGHTEYEEGSNVDLESIKQAGRENFRARGEFFYDATIRCPKNNEVILSFSIEVENGDMFDVLVNWGNMKEGSTSEEDTESNWPPAEGQFDKEIQGAINDYSGGLDFIALEKARAILATRGREICAN